MPVIDTAVLTVHLAVAALWTGAVLFFTWTVLGRAREGDLGPGPLGGIAGQLVWLSRASALVMLATGGHMAGTGYTVASLTGSGRGHLVLTMVGLWLLLAGLVEVAGARIRRGTDERKVREPARGARRPLYAAGLVAIALLVVAGLLSAA